MIDRPDPPIDEPTPLDPTTEVCRNCCDFRQFNPGTDGPGECMMRPPVLTGHAFENRPRVMPDDWCRSWSPNGMARAVGEFNQWRAEFDAEVAAWDRILKPTRRSRKEAQP